MTQVYRLARFLWLQELLPTDIPAFEDFLKWQTSRSLARFQKGKRLPKLYASLHPSLREKEGSQLTAYARFVGRAVDFYVLGFDEKFGLIGVPCPRPSGLLGFLQIIPDQLRFNRWSSDYQDHIRMDFTFTPRPLSECAKLTLAEARG